MPLSRREVLASVPFVPALTAGKGTWQPPREVRGTVDGVPGSSTLEVYLPRGYSQSKRHPLVIALHGWNHSPELWRRRGDLGLHADRGGFVLAVPAMGKSIYETRFYKETKSSWSAAPGARWIGEVILPFVRAQLAVHADRANTAIVGYSTGGRGAVLVAEAYPEFSFAGALSGTYDLMRLQPGEGEYKIHEAMYGPREAFAERWELDNCIAAARLDRLGATRLYAAHGERDEVVKPDQLEALREALRGRKVSATLKAVPGAGHDWKFWNAQWAPLFEAFTAAR